MPPHFQRPAPAPRGHQHRSTCAWAATIVLRSSVQAWASILRRSVRSTTAAVLSATLLAAVTCTAPAAQARPAEPGPAVPVPGPSARPPSTRPVVGPAAVPAGDLGSLRSRATRLRAKLDGQHRRLEVLSEDLEEAYARGVGLLAEASHLDRRRQAAEREVAAAQAELDERARSSYMAGPGWFVANLVGADDPADVLARLPLQRAVLDADLALVDRVARAKKRLDHTRSRLSERLVDQARGAEQLDAKRAEAERLADDIQRELRTMDRRVATLIEQEQRREEATQRAAFAGYLAAARTAGTAPARDGRASPAAAKAVEAALAQLGSPYVWGAEGPSTFDCSGLTSFAYAAAGVTIPRVSRSQFSAYVGMRPVDSMHLVPGDLVFFADNPRNPATIHHVGLYIGRGLMVEAPHTGAVVRTSPIWRPSYAGAVRPAP